MNLNKIKRKINIFFLQKLNSPYFHQNRADLVFYAFLFCFCIIFIRASWLHLFSSSKILNNIAEQQYKTAVKIAPYRGTIYDHKYNPLAISIKKPSIAINPKAFNPSNTDIKKLSEILNLDFDKIKKTESKENYFAWLKRKINPNLLLHIQEFKLKGLYTIMEPARFYPHNEHAAHLLGFVGTDDTGLLGIERIYDNKLKGQSEEFLSLRDAKGEQILLNAAKALPQQSGFNIILTLDTVIQEITERALNKWIKKSKAKGGFAIVADPHTGRILSIANSPSFNPNNPKLVDIERTKNQALTSLFEPGSVMKTFVIASALEKGFTRKNSLHNCENGRYKVGPRSYIHDDYPKKTLNTAETLVFSNNICSFKIAQLVGEKGLWNTLKQFGFASGKPCVPFPGAQSGRIDKPETWAAIRFANISFGQGLLVSGLEMIRAYSVIANGGNLVSPYYLDRMETEDGQILQNTEVNITKNVLSPKTSVLLKEILKQTVEEGGGKLAQSKSYTTAGKTGTAEKVDPKTHQYGPDLRIANFIGFAPVRDPYILAYIVIDEPQEKPYYGGRWAAPAFSEIVSETLKYLNVAPDKPSMKPITKDMKSIQVQP